jgi:HK97 family phage major capsid protein
MLLAARSKMEFDQGVRNRGLDHVARTMTGDIGGLGGFTLKPEMADAAWDKARSVDGPFARCTLRTTSQREFRIPGFSETSRAAGYRWGGVLGTWGLPETSVPASSQPATSLINFDMKRLLVYTAPISRDLLADTDLIVPLLSYASLSEIRFSIELAMVQGVVGGPMGVTRAGGTGTDGSAAGRGVVQVAKSESQASGTINDTNITQMWSALYGPCKRNAIWCANDDTIDAIDDAATSYNWPESFYLPQGVGGNPFPLLKGRPLVPAEVCPVIGTPGDLVLADWSQYWFVMRRSTSGESTLAFDVAIPKNIGHQGIVALPEGVVEQRAADELFFNIDSVAFLWKMRADGQSIWSSTMANINGATVGWAAIIQQR